MVSHWLDWGALKDQFVCLDRQLLWEMIQTELNQTQGSSQAVFLLQPLTRTHNPEDQAQDHVFCQGSPELCLFSLLYILSIFPHFLFCFFIPALSISKFLSPCCHQHILPCALLIFCSTNSAILVSPRWCSPACGHY